MNAKILTIGDELLIGQVIDSNSAWIGAELEKINIKVEEIRSIQDDHGIIINTLEELVGKVKVVIITGGLGPTKDDVTKKALADFLGVDLEFHQASYDIMAHLFKKYDIAITERHKSQALLPVGSKVLENKMGTAQGIWMEKKGTIIISMPGVPYEMKYIMQHSGLKKLSTLNPDGNVFHKTIMTAGWGETMIEDKISHIISDLPDHIKVAYLPGLGNVRVRISSNSSSNSQNEVEIIKEQIVKELGSIVYGYDDVKLQEAVGNLLIERQLYLGAAESCTGGYLSHLITSIPGSSKYYKGTIVSYADELKINLLKVKAETIQKEGAVSENTVKEMVLGLLELLNVDVAIAASGIAGPSGGTPEKPVGTIWIACGNKEKVITKKLQLSKNRLKNIEYTSITGLNMLRKFLSPQ